MKLSIALLGHFIDASPQFPHPIKFNEGDFDFPETDIELAGEWSKLKRCGQATDPLNPDQSKHGKDQRTDTNCPNVLLINTDDMAWGDVSINNPSKMIPTPNLDKMVSKGINFRDGHSCTARCAPSRYCLMTGRYHFRRGDYHYKPMELEYGRKVLTHLFKRNNYHTMVVGKPQPVEAAISTNNAAKTDFYFIEGTGFWGYDRSFTSRSYCCLPGGGYFVNDQPRQNFSKWAIFSDFRVEDEGSVQISPEDEALFWQNPNNYHLLDGYSVDGKPDSEFRPTTYMAYWNAVNNNVPSGLNTNRRRRDVDGKLIRRATRHNRKKRSFNKQQKQNIIDELNTHRIRRSSNKAPKNSYVRFQHKNTGRVVLANHRLIAGADRSNYEFAVNGTMFDNFADAEAARQKAITECDPNVMACNDMKQSRPKRTQAGFDSRTIMQTFAHTAIDYMGEHVNEHNPIKEATEARSTTENQPFFLYLSFRAPHRPYSHEYDFDPEEPDAHMPYTALGKPGEQLGLFDKYIGKVMKSLHDNKIADNTLVFFTSDNGPDQGAFNLFNKMGHMRMVTMRGKKASVYEGGHRVPFLSWWPAGTHQALQGTNFDLPVGQVDFFATFADILNYPLPGKETCTYAFDSDTAPAGTDPSKLGRLRRGTTQTSHQYENSFTWTEKVKKFATNPCLSRVGVKQRASRECEWVTCDQCNQFWDDEVGTAEYRTQDWMNVMKNVFCVNGAGFKCVDTTNGFTAEVQIKTGLKLNYLKEVQKMGYTNTERFWTKEEKTGFMLGWEGCMAEDSHSFAAAYKVKNESPPVKEDKNGKKYKEFKSALERVPSKIYAGKLGDLSLRLGRYKLVRFNAPKDYRTGPTRQHLDTHTKHEGAAWLQGDWNTRCSYDEEGNALNPGCTIEPDCRNTTTFGHKTCMRDHYYQLWDLEKNFGEKVMCDNDSTNPKLNANLDLEQILGIARAFDMGAEGTKAPEKPSDKYGFGSGIESTPVGEWQNDCCVLNHDETPTVDPATVDMCSMKRIKKGANHNGFDSATGLANDDNRKEWTGGSCVEIKMMKKGNDLISYQEWTEKHKAYILNHRNMNYTKYGWSEETHFSGFEELEEGVNWELGYGCSGVPLAKPHRNFENINNQVIWDDKLQAWRHTSMADKVCSPPKPVTSQPFNVGCKVPDHDGPLGQGWESNSQWKEATNQHNDRYNSSIANGEVNPADFGAWAPFVNCLKGAMKLIEGQAYYPETREELTVLGKANYISKIFENEIPVMGGMGPNGSPSPFNEDILAGNLVGSSKMAKHNAKNLWRAIKAPQDDINRQFHGAGSRYIEEQTDGSDALIAKCVDLRPSGTADPYEIKPTYDLEQNLMGYYETNDETGGQNTRLKWDEENERLVDDRKLMPYYRKKNGKYLKAFAPLY